MAARTRSLVAVAGLLLLIVSIPLLVIGPLLVLFGPRPCEGPGFGCALNGLIFIFGVIALVVGIAHVAAGVGVLRRRGWGRWLGAGIAALGLVIWLWLGKEQLSSVWPVVPVVVYGVTLWALIRWERPVSIDRAEAGHSPE